MHEFEQEHVVLEHKKKATETCQHASFWSYMTHFHFIICKIFAFGLVISGLENPVQIGLCSLKVVHIIDIH